MIGEFFWLIGGVTFWIAKDSGIGRTIKDDFEFAVAKASSDKSYDQEVIEAKNFPSAVAWSLCSKLDCIYVANVDYLGGFYDYTREGNLSCIFDHLMYKRGFVHTGWRVARLEKYPTRGYEITGAPPLDQLVCKVKSQNEYILLRGFDVVKQSCLFNLVNSISGHNIFVPYMEKLARKILQYQTKGRIENDVRMFGEEVAVANTLRLNNIGYFRAEEFIQNDNMLYLIWRYNECKKRWRVDYGVNCSTSEAVKRDIKKGTNGLPMVSPLGEMMVGAPTYCPTGANYENYGSPWNTLIIQIILMFLAPLLLIGIISYLSYFY